jgi:hypothetical protein
VTGWGGKRHGAGRKRTAHLRLIHLASCIEDWAAEEGNCRGAVKQALLEIYEMEHVDGADHRELEAFLETTKKDLRDGRRLMRELKEFLRTRHQSKT